MSFLKKLFREKSPAGDARPTATPPKAGSSDPAKDPNMVQVFDAYGREMFITKQAWRDSILLGHIKKVWNDPNALYSIIVQSLKDGFGADMIGPAEHLAKTDPSPERGAVVLAIVYREQKRISDSEEVLQRHIERHGESGVVLTNLAKIYADRGEERRVLNTLWRGLQLDPNQENGLGWYWVIHRDKEGPAAGLEALRRVANVPGSWRARLWLARDALDQRNLAGALAIYEEALALAPSPLPFELLQQVSGDLGNHAHLPEIISIVGPLFDPAIHGIAVGNNLIKAHCDLGQLDHARALVDRLYSLKRPDWQKHLAFWDTEIARARNQAEAVGMPSSPKVTNVSIDGPIWLRASLAAKIQFAAKESGAVIIACLGSTFSQAATSTGETRLQLSDTPGRVSRSLPLFLAEQVHLRTDAVGRVLQPWVQEGHGGFVLCGAEYSDEQAIGQARMGSEPADYVAVLHLEGKSVPWRASLRFLRTIDGSLLGTASSPLAPDNPQGGFEALAAELLRLAKDHAQAHPAATPSFYQVPNGADFGQYQFRLEQGLAIAIAAIDDIKSGNLYGEREVLNDSIQFCLRLPTNPTARLLLAQVLVALKKVRPDIALEFKDKVTLLQREKPLTGPEQGIVEQIVSEVFSP